MDYLLPATLRDGLLTYLGDHPWKDVNGAIVLLQALRVAPEPVAAPAPVVDPPA